MITQLENDARFLQWAGMIATRKCYAYLKKNKRYVLLIEEDDTFTLITRPRRFGKTLAMSMMYRLHKQKKKIIMRKCLM